MEDGCRPSPMPSEDRHMSRTIVRYETRPERADENQRLIEKVFAQLAELAPAGLRYATFRLDDGVTFVHVVDQDGDGPSPLASVPAFEEFTSGIAGRTVAAPKAHAAALVGSYGTPTAPSVPVASAALPSAAATDGGADAGAGGNGGAGPDGRSPVEVAVAFVEAFGRNDMAAVGRYLDDDVEFESPRARLSGAEAVLGAIAGFASVVTGLTVLAAHGDGERATVVYEMETGPFGTLRAIDHVVVRDGRITSDMLVFDTHPLHAAEAPATG